MAGRSTCPDCGSPVDLVLVSNGIETRTVALDVTEEPGSEADRYRIIADNPLRAAKVMAGSRGMTEHTFDCPGHNAGKRDRTR